MRKIVLLFLALITNMTLMAQTTLKGKVMDATLNEPLIGATVMVKGTSAGSVADIDGNFTLTVPKGKTLIVVSSIGYQSQTINIAGRNNITVKLKEDSKMMDEVVVVGYGQMKKSDLSGALSQLKGEDMMKGGAIDIAHGMQGKIAGVNIQQSDGAPGGGMSIVVRGTNSFSTSSQPLYVVDGVPFESGSTPSNGATTNEQQSNPLSFINPHDIESIEILKDASATAIYGSRGANGVVLIQTKKGKSGKPKVEVNATWGWSNISKKLDMLDPVTYATYINEQNLNDRVYNGSKSTTLPYPGSWGYQYYPDGTPNYNTGKYTGSPEDYRHGGWFYDEYGNATQLGTADWQDEIFQVAAQQDYNVNVSGGDDRGYYSFSGNYADQDGIIKNSGYKRYALRANISRKVTDWLEVGTNQSFTSSTTDFANTLSFNTGVVRSALLFPPTYGPNMDTTTADELNWLAANPGAYVRSAKDQLEGSNYFSSSFIQLSFLKHFTFRQNLGLSSNIQHRNSYYDRHTQEGKTPVNGKGSNGQSTWKSVSAESILTYDNTFANIHHLNVMGAFTVESSSWTNKSQVTTNYPDDMTQDADPGRALDKAVLSGDKGKQRLASFLGRLNYTLKDRYILTASFRSDGSSKFTDANKWATFLSGALAWRASEEEFIKKLNIFSNLKLRISYGETGNQAIGSYRINSQLDTANYPFGGSLASGSADISWRGPVDTNIKWETTRQWNAGIDFGWFKNRLTLTVDFYYKKTRDLLQEVIIAPSNGFSNMLTNTGNVTNKGLEITIGATPVDTKDWKWNLNGNIAFNKNSIGGLEGDQFARTLWYGADNIFIQRNGCPIGSIYGYVEDGFYDNIQEVRADPQYTNAKDAVALSKVGEIKYRDLNGDGAITEADRTIIGDTNPDFTFGLTNNISWKNLSLSFLLQGSVGNDIFNGNLMDITMANIGNIPFDAYNSRWTAENYESAAWPKATGGYNRTFLLSDRYVENGSYLKLKNISLSYRLPHPFPGLEQLLVSFTATNVFTISNYSWYDPEVNAFGSDSSRRGVDIYSYPSSRTFTFGLGLTF